MLGISCPDGCAGIIATVIFDLGICSDFSYAKLIHVALQELAELGVERIVGRGTLIGEEPTTVFTNYVSGGEFIRVNYSNYCSQAIKTDFNSFVQRVAS